MKGSRLWLLLSVLLLLIIGPFLLFGEQLETLLDLKGAQAWMGSLGFAAWLGGILLLVADLVLPIPGTVVMSALGLTYGWFWGGIVSSIGSILSGMLAYWLSKKFGQRAALWLAGEKGLMQATTLFSSSKGGWLVALSRWMPVLPEAVACLAGMTRMPAQTFYTALAVGSVPVGFAFAAIGAWGIHQPTYALIASAVLPVLFYGAAGLILKRHKES